MMQIVNKTRRHVSLLPNKLSGFSLVDSNGIAVGEGVKGLLLHNGGTVCDDSFDENSAAAICRLLGFSDATSWSSGNDWGIQDSYNIHMDDVQCRSKIWSSCTFSDTHNCEHGEDVFLLCGETIFLIVVYE